MTPHINDLRLCKRRFKRISMGHLIVANFLEAICRSFISRRRCLLSKLAIHRIHFVAFDLNRFSQMPFCVSGARLPTGKTLSGRQMHQGLPIRNGDRRAFKRNQAPISEFGERSGDRFPGCPNTFCNLFLG